MNRKVVALLARRRILAHGQGATKRKRDHTRTSGRHKRAFRMRGRVRA